MTATCLGKFWAVTSFVAAVSAALGFCMPYWLKGEFVTEAGHVFPLYFGIFRRCSYPFVTEDNTVSVIEECGRYSSFLEIPSLFWQISTVTIGTGTCLSLILSLIGLASLCVRDIVTLRVARWLGILQLFSGLIMGGGVALYPKGWDTEEVRQACGVKAGPYQMGHCDLFWAFYLTSVGAGLTILCSALTCHAYHNKPLRLPSDDDDDV